MRNTFAAALRRVAACAGLAVMALSGMAQAEALRIGLITPPPHRWTIGANDLAGKLVEESGGRLTLNVFPSGQLGSEAQMLQQLQTGVVLGSVTVHIPEGSRPIALGALLVVMLLFRPDGITRGREFGLPRRRPDRSPVPPVPGSAGRAGDETEGTPS